MTTAARRARARSGVALLAVLAVLSSAPAEAQAAQTTPLVTPADAKRVLQRFERVNTHNNSSLAVEGQGAVESPPVQLIDDATFREVRNRGGRSLGDQGRFTRRHVFVPPQSEYPLQFLASARVDDGSRQLLVFARPTEGAPWKVSSAAGIVEEPVPELTEDDSGYAALLDADHAAALKVPPDGLAAALADLWSRSADVEAPATSDFFEAGPLTTEAVGGLVADLAAHGIAGDVQLAFEPAPYPVAAYVATGGRALVLFAVAVHETLRPTGSAAALVQPRSRARFGGLVVPGRYASVAYERLELLAAVVPSGGTADRVRVIGDYGGIVSAKATPVAASGSTA